MELRKTKDSLLPSSWGPTSAFASVHSRILNSYKYQKHQSIRSDRCCNLKYYFKQFCCHCFQVISVKRPSRHKTKHHLRKLLRCPCYLFIRDTSAHYSNASHRLKSMAPTKYIHDLSPTTPAARLTCKIFTCRSCLFTEICRNMSRRL